MDDNHVGDVGVVRGGLRVAASAKGRRRPGAGYSRSGAATDNDGHRL